MRHKYLARGEKMEKESIYWNEKKKTTTEGIEVFLGTILRMGYIHKDKIHDY